jgi:hypothetical protein
MSVRRAVGLGAMWLAAIPATAWILAQVSSATPAAAQSSAPEPIAITARPVSTAVPSRYVPTVGNRTTAAVLVRPDQRLAANTGRTATLIGPQTTGSLARRRPARSMPIAKSAPPQVSPTTAASAVGDEPLPVTVYRGSLLIESQPEGARVYIDKQLAGVTPLMVPDLVAGSHLIRLEADAHESWPGVVRVVADEHTRVVFPLRKVVKP